jgi:putative DNA primase/helicase
MPETWKSEICNGLDPIAVARTLCDRGMLKRAPDGFQTNKKITGVSTKVYVITPKIPTAAPTRRNDLLP